MPLLHAGGALPVEYYAQELEVSVSDLNGAIKVLAGTSVAKFIEDYSLEMAKYMLAHSKSEIRAVAQRCGYSPSGLFRFSGDALRCRRKIGGGTIVFLDEERSAVKFFVGRRGTLLKLILAVRPISGLFHRFYRTGSLCPVSIRGIARLQCTGSVEMVSFRRRPSNQGGSPVGEGFC